MEELKEAFYMTMELWVFLAVLASALVVEEVVKARQ